MAFEKYSSSGVMAYAIPLYAAPVLAGWSGASAAVIPVFATLFAALILKTRRLPDQPGGLALTVLGALLLNAAITGGLVGVGWLGAAALGAVPLPVWLPLGMGVSAAGLGIWRYRWTPEVDAMDRLMDQTLAALDQIDRDPDPD